MGRGIAGMEVNSSWSAMTVCVFVNDQADRLGILAALGAKLVLLRDGAMLVAVSAVPLLALEFDEDRAQ